MEERRAVSSIQKMKIVRKLIATIGFLALPFAGGVIAFAQKEIVRRLPNVPTSSHKPESASKIRPKKRGRGQSGYSYKDDYHEGLAMVKLNGKYGFIDESGALVISCKYNCAARFYDGLAGVELNSKWGFVDRSGDLVIPCKYDRVGCFSEGLCDVVLNGKYGFIDGTGALVIPCKYDLAFFFRNGLAKVVLNRTTWGRISKAGKWYDEAGDHSEGLSWVKLNDKYGFVDKSGVEVIPCKYDDAWAFSDGLACVKLNDKYGFIDKSETLVIPCKYDYAGSFSGGRARVWLNGKKGYINKTGVELWD